MNLDPYLIVKFMSVSYDYRYIIDFSLLVDIRFNKMYKISIILLS